MLIALLVAIGLAVLAYAVALARVVLARRVRPNLEAIGLGVVVNFFDTLGIGSFAPTTAWFKFRRLVPDRLIPPTMVVGLTPPAMAQSIIFLILLGVLVDPLLLFGCAMATLVGGIVGAPLVARARVWIVQLTVAIGLALAATAYAMTNLPSLPRRRQRDRAADRADAGRHPGQLRLRHPGQFRGRQLCADARDAEPDGHGPEAVLSDHGRRRFADGRRRERPPHRHRPDRPPRIVLGLAIGGIPAVLVAALIVKEMPIEILRWLVFVVVVYTSAVMFRAAAIGRREGERPGNAAIPRWPLS